MVWTRIRTVEHEPGAIEVWNLDVDEDDTFCTHMIATHNCKSFSSCLPAELAETQKYQDMSSLTERSIFLVTSTWKTPPPLLVFENVPRIQSRGKEWLSNIEAMLGAQGYAVHGSSHDCGELGGLAQSRRRYLLVARHREQVPEWLYRPPRRRIRGVGEVLSGLPVPYPGQTQGGPLHALDGLCALNWVRLALISQGKDWRDLPERVAVCAREGAEPARINPMLGCEPRAGVYGVRGWGDPSVTVVGQARIDNGAFAVADPRSECTRRDGAMGVRAWDDHSITVISNGSMHNGPWQVGDPRLGNAGEGGDEDPELATPTHELFEGEPPVVVGDEPIDLDSKKPVHLVIRAPDGTWHRPMTTLELLALQGFPVTFADGRWVDLDGGNKRDKRARIGNAVPPPAARAIAESCIETLDASRSGMFLMSAHGVWVAPAHDDAGPRAQVRHELEMNRP
jgi:site-specific DNA-cytosine methylase